jgi:hypothetical protein
MLFGPTGLFNLSKSPGGVEWMVKYPYALPALFNGVTLLVCLVVAGLWLRESNSTKKEMREYGLTFGNILKRIFRFKTNRQSSHDYALIQLDEPDAADIEKTTEVANSDRKGPILRTIWTRQLLQSLVAFTLLPLHNATFLHIFPLFLSMPTTSRQQAHPYRFVGGLGLPSPTVGLFLATVGIAGIFLQLFTYPRIHQRLGTQGTFRLANAIFPVTYLSAPYLALLVNHPLAKWIAMAAVLLTQVLARTMAIPSSVILLTEAAPHRNILGKVHGAGNTMSALASACGPAIGGLLMAKGLEIGAVGLVWWSWMCLISLAALLWNLIVAKSITINDKDEACGV